METKFLYKTVPYFQWARWSKKVSPPTLRRLILFLLILLSGITNVQTNANVNVTDTTRTFTYPTISTRKMAEPERTPHQTGVFIPVSDTKYPGNMTMIAQLTENGKVVVDTEVGVFAGEECRTAETSNTKGILYLTIPGEGTGTPLHFRINRNGQIVTLDCGLKYTDDAMYGSVRSPYLIKLLWDTNLPKFTGSGYWNDAAKWSTGAVPNATQNVFIDGDAKINTDLETAGFVINTGKSITVNPGKKLTISGKSVNNGTIKLLSDAANGTATLVGDVAGQAVVQQAAVNYRTYYLSSPVSGTVTTSANMGQSITFTESTDQWTSPTSFAGVNPTAGKGYGVQVSLGVDESLRGTATTLSFEGTLNNGEVKIPITFGNRQFNFLGNPYPSYLNTIKIVANPNITKSLWFYSRLTDNNTYQFTAYNIPAGLSIPDAEHDYGYIPPMQGFWVKAKADADYTFSNEMRAHKPSGSPAIFRAPQAAEKQVMRLQITNGTEKDETVILFCEEATSDWNSSKPMNPGLTIYTVKDGEKLALNSRTAIEYDVETPVGVKAAKGEYTFSVIKYENFGTDKAFLLDKLTDVSTDLTSGNYTVNFEEAYDNADRFAVVFPRSGVITGWEETTQTEFFVFAKNKRITVSSDALSGTIYVYNSVGQQVAAQAISGNLTTVSTALPEGVYVVKLNSQTVKVVVK